MLTASARPAVLLVLLVLLGAGPLGARAIGAPGTGARPAALLPGAVCTNLAVLSSWPIGRLVNQTIVVPAQETQLASLVPAAHAGYGGVILFGTSAPRDIASRLETLRSDVPGGAGLLVMTDEEGGGVQRMANLVGPIPWAAQMGATMTPPQIEALARTLGSKMARDGVNVDLAPVLDVDGRAIAPGPQDPDGFRSFGGSLKKVEADGIAFAQGLAAAHVMPVVKHFPGLGGATGNTDDGPVDTLPWRRLESGAVPAFAAAIKAGIPAVMVSNAIVPGLTDKMPASLSTKAVTGELRDRLGFKGLIITDSLSAKAISDAPLSLTVPQASLRALEAGVDMVLFDPASSMRRTLAVAGDIARAVLAGVSADKLSRARLVADVGRVMTAKGIDLCPLR